MKRIAFAFALCLSLLPGLAGAQTFNARRMAMGGAILGGRQGGEGANVAYRALPKPASNRTISLPIGLIPVLSNPPSFDSNKPDFNVFKIVNLVANPPWNLALGEPTAPSSDIKLDISNNSLSMDLGDLGRVFPQGHVRAYAATNAPTMGLTIHKVFVALAPLVEVDNDLNLDDALSGVLRDGATLLPNSTYTLHDHGRAQAAVALHVGMAQPVWTDGDRQHPSSTLYGGARVKLIRGLAYGEAYNDASFTTADPLLSSKIDLKYTGHYLDAGPGDGGMGYGLDAGAVWVRGQLELGLGVDDIGTSIGWNVREKDAVLNPDTGNIDETTLTGRAAFTSHVPAVAVCNVAWNDPRWMAVADMHHTMLATTVHAGYEHHVGSSVALRAGGGLDGSQRVQLSGGIGYAFGRIGIDLAIATNNRNLEGQRLAELGLGLELLH